MEVDYHHLYLGDSFKVLDSFPDKSIDFVVSSPPFKDDEVPYDYYDWFKDLLNKIERITKNHAFIFNSSTRLNEICKRFNPKRTFIWYKGVLKYAYRYEPIFMFEFNKELKINKRIWSDTFKFQPIHKWKVPYENPLGLYESLIKMIVKEEKAIVLDPFGGSGTTMEACLNLNKSSILIEINSKFCNIIKKRCFTKRPLDRRPKFKFFNGKMKEI